MANLRCGHGQVGTAGTKERLLADYTHPDGIANESIKAAWVMVTMDLAETAGEIVIGGSDVVAASGSQAGIRVGVATAVQNNKIAIITAPPGGSISVNDIWVDATVNGLDFTFAFMEL